MKNDQINTNMQASNDSPGNSMKPAKPHITVLPMTVSGWWALGVSAFGFASWIVLPIITVAFRNKYPITDTWVMPAIGTALIDAAAILNVLVICRWRERSVLNIVVALLVILMALLFTSIVVGESIAGA